VAALSVILPTSTRANHLLLTLESYAHQDCEFELIVIGSSEVVERYRDRLRMRIVTLPRSQAARVADGDRIFFADEGRILARDCLSRLAAGGDDVVLGPRHGVVSVWEPALKSLGARRLLHVMRENPMLDGPLFGVEDVARDVDAVLARFACIDPIWERLEPIVTLPDLSWLLGLAGGLSLPRRAAVELQDSDDDLDFAWRLARLGLRFRVDAGARGGQQARGEPRRIGPERLERFAAEHDAIDAGLLCQFFAGRDPRELNAIAAARRPGPIEAALAASTREWVRRIVRAADGVALW
jgi:glycosyltransferase involved in cell wall biosynthesis